MNLKGLFSKYIFSKEVAEENATLRDWKQESESNLAALKIMMDESKLANGLKDYQTVDKKAAWDKINQRTSSNTTPIKKILSIQRIAAILLLLIASIFTFKFTTLGIAEPNIYTYSKPEKITLHDGSQVTLDKESQLLENKHRSVTLEGRAYFDIASDPSAPFTVLLHHGLVTVLGTEFNITTNIQKTQIFVTEGRVKYEYNNEEIILSIGDMLTVENGKMAKTSNPTNLPDIWRNKTLKFENNSLHHVLENVAIYYNIKVIFPSNLKEDVCKINTIFKDESLEDVLKELTVISGLKYSLVDKKIIVESFKC